MCSLVNESAFEDTSSEYAAGELPISHYCWDVVSQGSFSYAVLLKYLKVIFLLLLSLLVGFSRYVDGQTPGVLRAGWYFSLVKANFSRIYCHFCLLGIWKYF